MSTFASMIRRVDHVTQSPAPLVEVHGPALRYVRRNTRHTVRSLAPLAGLTFSHLAKVERGELARVRPETFAALVAALGLDDPRVIQASPTADRTATAVPVAA